MKKMFILRNLGVTALLLFSIMFVSSQSYGQAIVLNEDFVGCTKGNYGSPDGANIAGIGTNASIGTQYIPALNGMQWSGQYVYQAGGSVKIGSSNNKGVIITPELNFTGDATLTFKAMRWDGDQSTFNLSISNGSLDQTTITVDNSDYVFMDFTVNVTGVTAPCKITFEAKQASKSRFFLDDVKIVAATVEEYPEVSLSTTSLDFGELAIGLSKELTFDVITKNTTSPVNLSFSTPFASTVYSLNPTTIEASLEEKTTTVTVKFTPVADDDPVFAFMIMVSNDDAETQYVNITGTATEPLEPVVSIMPTNYDFGAVSIDNDDDIYVDPYIELANVTEDILISIEPNDGVFYLDNDGNNTITAGAETFGTYVVFAPTSVGEFTAQMKLTGVTSSKVYGTMEMSGLGFDPALPVVVENIAQLKQYMNQNNLSIEFNPSYDSPVRVTATDKHNTVYIQDATGATYIMDPDNSWDGGNESYIVKTIEIGNGLDSLKLNVEAGVFNLVAAPDVLTHTKAIPAKAVTIEELNSNPDLYEWVLVMVPNVKYEMGVPMMDPSKIIDAEGNSISVSEMLFTLDGNREDVNVYGLFDKGSDMGWGRPSSIMPRGDFDFKVPAKIVSGFPTVLNAGEANDFNLVFDKGGYAIENEYETSLLSIKFIQENPELVIKSYSVDFDGNPMWSDVPFFDGVATLYSIKLDENNAIKLRAFPTVGGGQVSTIKVEFVIEEGGYPYNVDFVLASQTVDYTSNGTVPTVKPSVATLDFGDMIVGENTPIIRTFTLTKENINKDIKLSVSSDVSGTMTITPSVIPASEASPITVTVSYDPAVPHGSWQYNLWQRIVIEGEEILKPIEIPLAGHVVDLNAPRVDMDVEQGDFITFDDIQAGQTTSKVIKVTTRNLTADVDVYTTNYGASNVFYITPKIITASKEEKVTEVTITFAPIQAGEAVSEMYIVSKNEEFSSLYATPYGYATEGTSVPTLTSTLPKVVTVDEVKTFDLVFTPFGGIFDDVDIFVTSVDASLVKLEYYDKVTSAWKALDLTAEECIIPRLPYQATTVNMRLTALDEGENTIAFNAAGWNNGYTKLAGVTNDYTAEIGEPIPSITVDPESLTLAAGMGLLSEKLLVVTGKNLTENIQFGWTAIPEVATALSLKETSQWNALTGGEVVISFVPNDKIQDDAMSVINIRSGDVVKDVVVYTFITNGVNELLSNTVIFSYDKTIKVQFDGSVNAEVVVFDINGRVVAEQKANDTNSMQLDVNANAGVYVVRIIANGTTLTKKVTLK